MTREEFEEIVRKEREAQERLDRRRAEWSVQLRDFNTAVKMISLQIAQAVDRPLQFSEEACAALLERYNAARARREAHLKNPPMPEPAE